MLKVVQIFLIVLAIYFLSIIVTPHLSRYFVEIQAPRVPRPDALKGLTTTTTRAKKHVKFGSNVKIANAGGYKKDRYNPDLRSCVQRNAELALRVGGAKKLAEMTLQEAEESSSSSSRRR
jgi:hypothetical protein